VKLIDADENAVGDVPPFTTAARQLYPTVLANSFGDFTRGLSNKPSLVQPSDYLNTKRFKAFAPRPVSVSSSHSWLNMYL